jgi:hypothetical protein
LKLVHYTLLLFVGLAAFAGFTRWKSISEEPLIMTDGQGYYAYLPATFIYQNLQFLFVEQINERYYAEDKRANYVVQTENGNVNKYFVGTAVMQSPFFLVGCVGALITGQSVDGYSTPFQLMIGVAAASYLAVGWLFLVSLLVSLGYRKMIAVLAAILVVFATNLLYYTLYEPSMSHVYSFCTVSAFLYFGRRALIEATTRTAVLAAFALGLTVLIRPVNGLVLLGLPVVSGGLSGTLNGLELLLQKRKPLFIGLLIVLGVASIQPIVYLIQTGKPLVWSYQEEGFNFLKPEFWNVLFSYRKGLFVYCPILVVGVLGLIVGGAKRKSGFVEGWLFLLLITWVISSWWMWYYGGSYGHRAFIEYYPFFAIGLAHVLTKGIWFISPVLLILSTPFWVGVQMVQTYQYVNHIIPFDNMNKEKYWNLFLMTGDDLRWYYSAYPGQDSYRALDSLLIVHDMESHYGWGNEDQFTTEQAYIGSKSTKMETKHQYGITLRKSVSELPNGVNTVRVGAWVRPSSVKTDLSIVCAIEDSLGQTYFWRSYPLRPQFNGKNTWAWTTALFESGEPRSKGDRIVVYPMREDASILYLDNLEVSFIKAQ